MGFTSRIQKKMGGKINAMIDLGHTAGLEMNEQKSSVLIFNLKLKRLEV